MCSFNFLGLDTGRNECGFGHVAEQFKHSAALAFNIAAKVGLGPAQNENLCGHVSLLL